MSPTAALAYSPPPLDALRRHSPRIGVEFLTPDFRNVQTQAVASVMRVLDDTSVTNLTPNTRLVWGHNMETVPRLYRNVRKGAKYERSLELLAQVSALPGVQGKSALILAV